MVIPLNWTEINLETINLERFKFGGGQQFWYAMTIVRKYNEQLATIVIPIYILARVNTIHKFITRL
jgi:hypothetical protein